jgi:Baseplate J-like protein
MSGTTNVPPPVFTTAGYQAPLESAILVGALADINAAFGGALVVKDASGNPEVRTPQGQLAMTEAATIGDQNDQVLAVLNGMDPALSTGRQQDGIGRIYFLDRLPALPTVVPVQCIGAALTVIPAGTPIGGKDGNTWIAQSSGEIILQGGIGQVTIDFQCVTTGPIPCPVGNVSIMQQVIFGWDSASNLVEGILGQDVESPSQFEARRAESVAGNSNGTIPAIQGSVLSVAGILDAFVTDNVTAANVVLDGVTLPPHSLYVCTAGGAPHDIAMAIWKKKQPGGPYATANTTVVVTDPSPSYAANAPTYPVTWEVAAGAEMVMTVTITNSTSVPSNAATLIANAVLSAFAGNDGGPRARIGQTQYALRYACPIMALGAWAKVISIKLAIATIPDATFTGTIVGTALTLSAAATGAIVVGATLIGPGIPDGTTIASGAALAWVTSQPAPVPAGTAMRTVTPKYDDVAIGVAHIPTLTAPNIITVLQ